MKQNTDRDFHKEWGILTGTLRSIQRELNLGYSTPMTKVGKIRELVEREKVREILQL